MYGKVIIWFSRIWSRSVATNLLKAKDVPLAAMLKTLRHSKITTTMRYLRAGVEENAALLAESSYYTLGTAGDGCKE